MSNDNTFNIKTLYSLMGKKEDINTITLDNIDLIKIFEKSKNVNYCVIEGVEEHLFLFLDEELEILKDKIKKYGCVRINITDK